YLVTHLERGMQDFLPPFGRHWILFLLAFVGHHEFDFTVKTLSIELERRFALAVESKVRIQLHRSHPPSVLVVWVSVMRQAYRAAVPASWLSILRQRMDSGPVRLERLARHSFTTRPKSSRQV